MHLTNLLDEKRILLNQSVQNSEELYRRLIRTIMDSDFQAVNSDLTEQQLIDSVLQREARGSTALGNGFAYPHARVPGCTGAAIAIATLSPPLVFAGTPDEQPIDTVCLTIGPEEDPNLFLKVMSSLAQFIGDAGHRAGLLKAEDSREAYNVLADSNLSTDIPVLAQDIMRPLYLKLKPDDLLKKVAHEMLQNNLEAAPVLDEQGKVVGEISSDLLFQYGLPDFFSQLRSVSFIREFDPFEKYFEQEARSVASEVMSKDFASMNTDATLLEIVFLLAVKKHPKVYIENGDGQCVGVIDRILVLERVINI
ncbi:MAG: PTS sugar transporter subunit IIA [Lentisphaeria bacterium]